MRKNLNNFIMMESSTQIWQYLKDYVIQNDPSVVDKPLYVCTYCRPVLNSNKFSARNNVRQSDIVRTKYGMSEQVSIYPIEISGQKRTREEAEDGHEKNSG